MIHKLKDGLSIEIDGEIINESISPLGKGWVANVFTRNNGIITRYSVVSTGNCLVGEYSVDEYIEYLNSVEEWERLKAAQSKTE